MSKNILHWSYRDFRNFPEDLLEHRESVEEIYLKENFIPSLPKWLFDFTNLRFIHLGGNLLEYIPADICMLENLEFLDVSKNHIRELPVTFSRMLKLKRLNISDNLLRHITKDIGAIRELETLDISKNSVSMLPIELAQCQHLNELVVNDNPLLVIPNKIINLPKLEVLEADRCYLQYLPGTIGRMLTHVRVFNNTRLTHYPVIYEKFLRRHYDYWSENVVSADQMMVFLPDESKHTILPRGLTKVHLHAMRTPATLIELGLRSLYQSKSFYKMICGWLQDGILPQEIHARIMEGPNTICGHEECGKPIFTEAFFILLRKNRSASHIIFSNMFCSMDCKQRWMNENEARYHIISLSSVF